MSHVPFAAAALALWPLLAAAGALRDPMQPPEPPTARAAATARQAATAASGASSATAATPARQLLTIGAQRWLLDGGRRLAVGDDWLGGRIERIDETEIVLRQGGTLRRVPLYAGVTKQAATAPAAPAASPAPTNTLTAEASR